MRKSVLRTALRSGTAVLLCFGAARLLVHFAFGGRYGFFRDELYFIVCGGRLDFGYVDQPPLTPLAARLARLFFGDSLPGLRLLPALAGAAAIVLAGLIARRLGGGRGAQALAAVSVFFVPVLLGFGGMLTPNAFDVLFWTLAAYLLVLILKDGRRRLWPLFGLVVGLALQNKYSIAFFVAALGLGFLLTSARSELLRGRFWGGFAVALAVFLPNLLWQVRHGLPFIELNRNAVAHKNAVLTPLQFLGGQATEALPLTMLIILAGIGYFWFGRDARPVRAFAWAYLALLAFFVFSGGKTYYMAPAYPVMLAGGAVVLERFASRPKRRWLVPACLVLTAAFGAAAAPLAVPVLSPGGLVSYMRGLGIAPQAGERQELGPLPQHFADQFGWEGLAADVARVYRGLDGSDRAVCGIFAQNYGEASAVNVLGRRFGLPFAASGHNNYWLWGPPPGRGEVMIVIGGKAEDHLRTYGQVVEAARHFDALAMPYESGLAIYLCRGLKVPLADVWPRVKHYI